MSRCRCESTSVGFETDASDALSIAAIMTLDPTTDAGRAIGVWIVPGQTAFRLGQSPDFPFDHRAKHNHAAVERRG
jgi:hypothetical protein